MTEIDINLDTQNTPDRRNSIFGYFRSVRLELGNVTWPDRAHVIRASAIVIALCVGASVLVGIFDYVLTALMIWLRHSI